MNVSRLAGFLVLLLSALSVGCSAGEDPGLLGEDPASSAATEAADDGDRCREEATRAEAEIEVGGRVASTENQRLAQTAATLGSPYGVPTSGYISGWGFLWGDWDEVYEDATGERAWRNPEAHDAYEAAEADCLERSGRTPRSSGDPLGEWTPPQRAATRCVTEAVLSTEERYGRGSVAYRAAYLQYVESRTPADTEPDYLFNELAYAELLGISPFADAAAVETFRGIAGACIN